MGIKETNFSFSGQTSFYRGKVRDVYGVDDQLAIVSSDRISAFDYVLPKPIPYKGQVLNQISSYFLMDSKKVAPNWLEASPDPNVSIGVKCEPIKVEMVIRGYLAGHAWREYKKGKRLICGVTLPEGMKESDRFPIPIITPSTKADEGHDEDITREAILDTGLVSKQIYERMEKYTYALFAYGSQKAKENGLILVDTKYEFGLYNGQLLVIDEIHTPDSSRYYYLEGYKERQRVGERQKQLSKEFVREWLMDHGFQGKEGQQMPEMPDSFVSEVSNRYILLYEALTGSKFIKRDYSNILIDMESSINEYFNKS